VGINRKVPTYIKLRNIL